jgi:Ion channel
MNRDWWLQRAQRASDAFGLVLLLVLTTYVLASLVANDGWGAALLTAITATTSVVALVSSQAHTRTVRAAIALGVLSTVLATVAAATDERIWLNVASIVQIALLATAMLAVLRRVVTATEIGFRTILGAVSVYVVLGLLFSFSYATIDRIQSGPFFSEVAHPTGTDFLFFSYTTLTTTGYGDLVPGGQPGQMVAGLEMMIGQLFLVTLVAGLVSLWRPGEGLLRRRERKSGGPPAGAPPAG